MTPFWVLVILLLSRQKAVLLTNSSTFCDQKAMEQVVGHQFSELEASAIDGSEE
jgi:hypothetical protein